MLVLPFRFHHRCAAAQVPDHHERAAVGHHTLTTTHTTCYRAPQLYRREAALDHECAAAATLVATAAPYRIDTTTQRRYVRIRSLAGRGGGSGGARRRGAHCGRRIAAP